MSVGNPPVQQINLPTGQHFGASEYTAVQVILPGTAVDLPYNGSSGALAIAGPFSSGVIRIALPTTNNARFWRGAQGSQVGAGTLFVGPGVEYFGINSGEYVMALSNDASTGTINITPAS